MGNESLYDRLGGRDAISAAVEIFYRKVINDDRITHFFNNTDLRAQLTKQKQFLAYAFGAPTKYDGKNLRDAHAHLVQEGMTDVHFDAVVENLAETLTEMGVPNDMISEVAAVAESVRADVLGR